YQVRDLKKEKRKKIRLTKKQKKGIIVGSIVVFAAIFIPVISILVYEYQNPHRQVNFYVNNGLASRSYTVSTTRDTLDYFNSLSHPSHNYWDANDSAVAIESYCTPTDGRILQIAQAIRSKCIDQYDSEEVINALLSFTQAIGYKSEIIDVGKYPLQTIFNQGDCEDLSILFGSLIVSLGYSAILMIIDYYDEMEEEWLGHASVGVYLSYTPTAHPSSYHFDITGNEYWICETTSQGWLIGHLPASNPNDYLLEGYAYIN
ncbi:MAG: hypothetical protein ACXAC5_25010, partial [Promethearchaeota archaeon]